ncbi:hypothetical protein EDD85DRAFT_941183 [Armillaria nabsnona]|nr:hypothetical protein EDD85DRAFT_941183 [Armillaria nabsnona]
MSRYCAPQPARSPALLAGRASLPYQYSPKILCRHAKVLFEAAFANHTPGAGSKTAELLRAPSLTDKAGAPETSGSGIGRNTRCEWDCYSKTWALMQMIHNISNFSHQANCARLMLLQCILCIVVLVYGHTIMRNDARLEIRC